MVDKSKKNGSSFTGSGRAESGAGNSNIIRSFFFIMVMAVMVGFIISNFSTSSEKKTEVPISEVIARANDEEGDISKITVIGSDLEITLKGKDQPTEYSRKDGSGTLYDQGLIDYCGGLSGDSLKECQEAYPTIEYKEDIDTWGIILNVALTVLPIVALIIFFSWMMRQATSANNQSLSFGKSRARLYGPDKKKVTFKDVAGLNEEK